MKFLTTLDQEKIRAELRGKPKPEDVTYPPTAYSNQFQVISIDNLKIKLNPRLGNYKKEALKNLKPLSQIHRQYLTKMLELLIMRKNEYEISVNDSTNDFAYLSAGDESTILEPLFLNLREQCKEQLIRRSKYFKKMRVLSQVLDSQIFNRLLKYEDQQVEDFGGFGGIDDANGLDVNHAQQYVDVGKESEEKQLYKLTHKDDSKDKKKNDSVYKIRRWGALEKIYMNCRLGFSNWMEVDWFEKENKFVKKLRNSIFKNGVSRLVYQNLTKKEKTGVGAYFDLKGTGKEAIGGLIDVNRFTPAIKKEMFMNFTVGVEGQVILKLVHQTKGEFLSYFGSIFLFLEIEEANFGVECMRIMKTFEFTMEDVYQLRRMIHFDKKMKLKNKYKKEEEKYTFLQFLSIF